MRFNFFFIFIFILGCSIFACKETSNKQTVEKTPTTPEEVIPKIESEPIPVIPNSEIPVLKQETPLTAYAQQFYTNIYWHYEAAVVIKNPEKSKAYIGKWIKFNVDNTLETGFFDGTGIKGTWVLDEGKNLLTLAENGAQPIYSEWKVQTSSSSDAIMIWVGTKRFNQNNTQIKLMRYHEKPVKGN